MFQTVTWRNCMHFTHHIGKSTLNANTSLYISKRTVTLRCFSITLSSLDSHFLLKEIKKAAACTRFHSLMKSSIQHKARLELATYQTWLKA